MSDFESGLATQVRLLPGEQSTRSGAVSASLDLAPHNLSVPNAVPSGRTKRVMGRVAFLVFVAASLALSWNFHQAANAAPVTAIWQQPTVTVDDREVAALAQSWQAPFEVVYAAQGADITVRRGVALEPMTGGLATRDEDGDRIEGCALDLRAGASEFVMVHEVGHCLGYAGHSHAGKGESVMAQYEWDASPVVTDADRAELAALYAGGVR